MEDELTNETRAEWALDAVNHFVPHTGQGEVDLADGDLDGNAAEVIGDLIGNLLHLATKMHLDVSSILGHGIGHYAAEIEEEDDEAFFLGEFMFEAGQAAGILVGGGA